MVPSKPCARRSEASSWLAALALVACAPQQTQPPAAQVATVQLADARASEPTPDGGTIGIGELETVATGTGHTVTHTPSPEPEASENRARCAKGEPAGCHAAALDAYYSPPSKVTDRDAREYFQKGCDAGYAPSCNGLGLLHHEGRGVNQDDREAARIYFQACMSGSSTACDHLADALGAGRGVPKDPAAAERARKRKKCATDGTTDGGVATNCAEIFTSGRLPP